MDLGTHTRGDTLSRTLTLPSGVTAAEFTGGLKFTVRANFPASSVTDDLLALAQATSDPGGGITGDGGTVDVEVPAAATQAWPVKALVWDLQGIVDGATPVVRTLLSGTLQVAADVTRSPALALPPLPPTPEQPEWFASKVAALDAVSTPLAGTELLPIVQSETTRKVTAAVLAAMLAALTPTTITQAEWHVRADGDDTADGATAETALATLEELCARFQFKRISQNTDVYLGPGNLGTLDLQVTVDTTARLVFRGTVTNGPEQTLSSVTNRNPTTETRGAVAVASGGSFAAGQRLCLTSGSPGAIAYVTRAISADSANVGGWAAPNAGLTGVTATNAAVANTFVTQTLETSIDFSRIAKSGGNVVVQDVHMPTGVAGICPQSVLFFGCRGTFFFDPGANVQFLNCAPSIVVFVKANLAFTNCVFTSSLSASDGSQLRFLGANVWYGLSGSTSGVSISNGGFADISTGDLEFSSCNAASGQAIALFPGAVFRHRSGRHVWGVDNTFARGLQVTGGASYFYGNAAPKVRGGTNDLSIGDTSKAYTDLPYADSTKLATVAQLTAGV